MPDPIDAPAFTADAGIPIRRSRWALVRDGVIERVEHSLDHLRHPFGDDAEGAYHAPHDGRQIEVPRTGLTVLKVTGTEAAVGHLVDTKGNVTPLEGRTEALADNEPAYLDGPGVVRTIADTAAQLQGGEPIAEKSLQAPDGAPVEQRDENEPSLGMSQPHAAAEPVEREPHDEGERPHDEHKADDEPHEG